MELISSTTPSPPTTSNALVSQPAIQEAQSSPSSNELGAYSPLHTPEIFGIYERKLETEAAAAMPTNEYGSEWQYQQQQPQYQQQQELQPIVVQDPQANLLNAWDIHSYNNNYQYDSAYGHQGYCNYYTNNGAYTTPQGQEQYFQRHFDPYGANTESLGLINSYTGENVCQVD